MKKWWKKDKKMYETLDIYIAFRRAQAEFNNRGYRIPKDFDKHLKTKMSKKNREALELATKYFNTKWTNINPDKFFDCGFELYKSFTYLQFFEPKVLNIYKVRDKNHKREMEIDKGELKKSIAWVKHWISKYNGEKLKGVRDYCRLRDKNFSVPVQHYLHNKIDKYFLVHLISKGVLKLTDEDRALIPYIVEQYRECLVKLEEMKGV